jgi:hypothetical protein
MSVIIITNGGGGKDAMHRLFTAAPKMTPAQITAAEALIDKFITDVDAFLNTVK